MVKGRSRAMEEINGTFLARMILWMRENGISDKDILSCIEFIVNDAAESETE